MIRCTIWSWARDKELSEHDVMSQTLTILACGAAAK
jgi:hypothetical protein